MTIGMLWFDNDPKTTIQGRIEKALEYYRRKYQKDPNLVLVNPKDLPAEHNLPMELRAERTIRPGHIWIGQESKPGDG
jgi:hypothetical protein